MLLRWLVDIYEHYQKPVLEFFIFSKTQKMVSVCWNPILLHEIYLKLIKIPWR